jgi:hypothetical protein
LSVSWVAPRRLGNCSATQTGKQSKQVSKHGMRHLYHILVTSCFYRRCEASLRSVVTSRKVSSRCPLGGRTPTTPSSSSSSFDTPTHLYDTYLVVDRRSSGHDGDDGCCRIYDTVAVRKRSAVCYADQAFFLGFVGEGIDFNKGLSETAQAGVMAESVVTYRRLLILC